MNSPGRQPRDQGGLLPPALKGRRVVQEICRPFGAPEGDGTSFLGLAPQAGQPSPFQGEPGIRFLRLHLEMVGGFAFLILAGGWLLTTALRKGYYLEIQTAKGIEKVRFDRRIAPEEIFPFLAEPEWRLGYRVENAENLPDSRH